MKGQDDWLLFYYDSRSIRQKWWRQIFVVCMIVLIMAAWWLW